MWRWVVRARQVYAYIQIYVGGGVCVAAVCVSGVCVSDVGCLLCSQRFSCLSDCHNDEERTGSESRGEGCQRGAVTVAGGIISLKRKLIYVLAVMFKLMLQKLNAHK